MRSGLTSGTVIRDGDWSYTLEERLGQGGFATVYRATMQRDGVRRRVAIKCLHLSAGMEPELVARLRDEARILSRLEHHAIVRVIGVVDVHGAPAVVMDLVDGVDLSTVIRRAALPPRAVCQLGADIASALDAAWSDLDPERGRPLRVIHRDVKPANILLTRRGAVRLVDFGVARADLDRDGTTRSQHQFGTSRYMAPECFDNETSHRSDVYALAMTLIESLTGKVVERLPVRRSRYRVELEARLRPLFQLDAPVPWTVELGALLEDMMHYDERRRPTARDVADRLSELADEAPGEGLRRVAPARVAAVLAERAARAPEPPSVPGPTDDPTIVSTPSPSESPSESHSGSCSDSLSPAGPPPGKFIVSRTLLVGVGVLLVLLGAGALLATIGGSKGPAPVLPAASESVPADVGGQPSRAAERAQPKKRAATPPTTTRRTSPKQKTTQAAEAEVARMPVEFRLSVGSGGSVTVDSEEHRLPWASTLTLGLHAVTFRHDGRESSQMIYVGTSASTVYVFDSSTQEIHAFK